MPIQFYITNEMKQEYDQEAKNIASWDDKLKIAGLIICGIQGIIFFKACKMIKNDYRQNFGLLAYFADEQT